MNPHFRQCSNDNCCFCVFSMYLKRSCIQELVNMAQSFNACIVPDRTVWINISNCLHFEVSNNLWFMMESAWIFSCFTWKILPSSFLAYSNSYFSFCSYYDPYRGVIVYFRVVDGTIKKGDRIYFMASGTVKFTLLYIYPLWKVINAS